MGDAKGTGIDTVEVIMRGSPDHSLSIKYQLSDVQTREGVLSLV